MSLFCSEPNSLGFVRVILVKLAASDASLVSHLGFGSQGLRGFGALKTLSPSKLRCKPRGFQIQREGSKVPTFKGTIRVPFRVPFREV